MTSAVLRVPTLRNRADAGPKTMGQALRGSLENGILMVDKLVERRAPARPIIALPKRLK
jgi:hypothetical protein